MAIECYKLIAKGQDILLMFTMEINSIDQLYSAQSPTSSPFMLQSSALEFQYQLCQIFLKKTGEQLHQKEAELMVSSQDFIKNLEQRDNEKDLCSSTDSGSEEVFTSIHDNEATSNLAFLKRGQGMLWRKIETKLAPCFNEIEDKCSALCVATMRSTISDYRHLVQKWWEIEAREGMMERKKIHFQREHEENLILKQKMNTQNLKLETMSCEIECLKQKNQTILDYANQRLQQMMGSQRLIEINSKVYRDIKNYLDDKERNAARRLLRAEALEQDLLNRISHFLPQDSCENCCIMLRKLKESLIKFKKYLENEGNEQQSIYNKYKKTLFSQKSNMKHF